tara:strand:+ start:825 stop:1352 length:528 start_codon:yes stop_codon:yes gene_type:complete
MAEFQHLKIELEKIGKELIGFMRSILDKQGHKASGNLDKSFRANVQVSDDLVELNVRSLVDYWERLNDYGVRNKKGVYVSQNVILNWMRQKGNLFSHLSKEDMKQAAYSISHRLASKYPTEFGMNSGKSDFVSKADIMATELGVYNNIDTALPKEIDEYFKYLEEGGNVIDIFAG